MNLVLYYAPMTCALVPYVTLTEAGASFEARSLDTRANEQRTPEFLAINPKHKVPVLLIDGEPLTENVAIQIWIARQFPDARLLPADAGDYIKAVSLMAWFSSTIHPHLTPNARPGNFCDLPGSEESVKRVGNRLLFEDLEIADARLAGRTWFFDHFTAVDAYFFWCLRRARSFGLDLAAYTHCTSHFERVGERASVKRLFDYEKEIQAGYTRAA